jgi:hypothetical protein
MPLDSNSCILSSKLNFPNSMPFNELKLRVFDFRKYSLEIVERGAYVI